MHFIELKEYAIDTQLQRKISKKPCREWFIEVSRGLGGTIWYLMTKYVP